MRAWRHRHVSSTHPKLCSKNRLPWKSQSWSFVHAAIQIFVLSSTYSFKNFCCWFLKGIFVLFSDEDDGKESNIVLQFKPFSTQLKPTREKFSLVKPHFSILVGGGFETKQNKKKKNSNNLEREFWKSVHTNSTMKTEILSVFQRGEENQKR